MSSKKTIFSFTKKDFEVDWFSGEGGGGQHRNKHKNSCRIKHLETGLIASCQEHKSAAQNKKKAFRKLVKLLMEHYNPERLKVRGKSEKRTRTYHKPDDRVTDHVTGIQYSYKETIDKGDMSKIIQDRIDKAFGR